MIGKVDRLNGAAVTAKGRQKQQLTVGDMEQLNTIGDGSKILKKLRATHQHGTVAQTDGA